MGDGDDGLSSRADRRGIAILPVAGSLYLDERDPSLRARDDNRVGSGIKASAPLIRSVQGLCPLIQPPAASRQPPAASRQPPAARPRYIRRAHRPSLFHRRDRYARSPLDRRRRDSDRRGVYAFRARPGTNPGAAAAAVGLRPVA